MNSEKIVAAVIGAAVLAWPWLQKAIQRPAAPSRRIGYVEAVERLGEVRARLVETGCLNEQQKAAIDTLTLALVSGSEQ